MILLISFLSLLSFLVNQEGLLSSVSVDWVVVFSAWQEVVEQEQRPEEAQGAVHYKEATPSPHMDGESCSY